MMKAERSFSLAEVGIPTDGSTAIVRGTLTPRRTLACMS